MTPPIGQRVLRPHPDLPLTLRDVGEGPPLMVLHGAGGTATIDPIIDHFAGHRRVVAPTHPGWDGTARPDRLRSVGDLAAAYLDVLAALDLTDVTVIGVSFGGWVATEMGAHDTAGRLAGLVVLDAMGPIIPGHELTAPAPGKPAAETASHARRGASDDWIALMTAYTGPTMQDPTLLPRLAEVRVPVLGIWGEHDPVTPPAYGRAFTDAFADSSFVIIPGAGHLPTSEAPGATFAAIDGFLRSSASGNGSAPEETR